MRTIYTALFGNYDELKQPTVVTPGWQYICFTDQYPAGQVGAWEIFHVDVVSGAEQKTARWFKILPPWMNPCHVDYDEALETIWVDASFTINCDLNWWWDNYFDSPFTCLNHPIRDDVYEEANACINHKRGPEDEIAPQIERYKQLGVPGHGKLISSGILMRRNTEEVRNFCKLWYEELLLGPSLRDQLAFAFVEWQWGVKHPDSKLISRVRWDYRNRKEFQFLQHIHRRRKLPTVNPTN